MNIFHNAANDYAVEINEGQSSFHKEIYVYKSIWRAVITQALMDALSMENNKVKIIKGFMADGLTKAEAKVKYTDIMNEMVGEALGIETSDSQDSEDASNEEE